MSAVMMEMRWATALDFELVTILAESKAFLMVVSMVAQTAFSRVVSTADWMVAKTVV